jgi:mycothiol synthase
MLPVLFNMTVITSRPYVHPQDLPALVDLLKSARPAAWINEYPSVFELQEAMDRPSIRENTCLWMNDDDGLLGFAFLLEPYNNFHFEIKPEVERDVEEKIIAWGMACAERSHVKGMPDTLDTSCRDDDHRRIAMLERQGFKRLEMNSLRLARNLNDPIPDPHLPKSFSIRHIAGENEVDKIVALHCAAFGASNMTIEDRLSMMRAPDYDPALDLVVIAPDNRFAGYCTCSIQSAENKRSGIKLGHTDPVAVHPDFQRQGLACALLLSGARLLKERGMELVMLGTSSENLAMQKAAQAAGFRVYSKRIWFSKKIPENKI